MKTNSKKKTSCNKDVEKKSSTHTGSKRRAGSSKYANATDDKGFTFNPAKRPVMEPENDASWYSLNEQLLRDTASFPYSWPLGNRLDVGDKGLDINKGSIPGIMALYWAPTIGYSSDATSAVNVASINTYTKIRHDNSGHANYDHQDYMLYLLAMDSVYAFHSFIKRIYGTAMLYSNTNRYYPRALVQTMGVSFPDVQRNLARLRAYINEYAVKASALAVPSKMSYMKKHYWMSENIYLDSNQDKPQTYIFVPVGFYKFGLDEGSEPKGHLSFEPLFGKNDAPGVSGKHIPNIPSTWEVPTFNGLTVDDLITYGDKLLDPIIADEDFGIMSGDTLKSFGVGGCYTLPFVTETYATTPVYEEEVLDIIQNTSLIGDIVIEDASITQSSTIDSGTGCVLATPKFAHPWVSSLSDSEMPGQNAFLVDRFVTFEHGDITPANTMVATRWTNVGTEVTEKDTRSYNVPTLGSEAMCCAKIWFMRMPNAVSAGAMLALDSPRIYVSMNIDCKSTVDAAVISSETLNSAMTTITSEMINKTQNMLLLIQQLGVFRRHPPVYLTSYQGITITMQGDADTHTTYTGSGQHYGHLNGVLSDVNY